LIFLFSFNAKLPHQETQISPTFPIRAKKLCRYIILMTWKGPAKQYSETVAFLRNVDKANDDLFTALQTYLTGIQEKFTTFRQETTFTAAGLARPDLSSKTPGPEATISPFIATSDCAIAAFKHAIIRFPEILPPLKTIHAEFHTKLESIIISMKSDLDALADAHTRFEAAYLTYKQAAADLQTAADRKSPTIPELKSAFVKAQTDAINVHTRGNEMTAQTAMRMEAALTSYEEAEQWKTDKIRAFFATVADWCDKFAERFELSHRTIQGLKGNVMSNEGLIAIFDAALVPDPHACDEFVVVRIDPVVSQFIDGPSLFPDAAKEGRSVFRVIKECPAEGKKLGVAAGEFVCMIEDGGDVALVVNVNDVQGIVPKAALVRV
jgi:exonuclease VII small subunit